MPEEQERGEGRPTRERPDPEKRPVEPPSERPPKDRDDRPPQPDRRHG